MDLLTVVFRTIIFYFIIAIIYRVMGKREIGQLGIMDLIVSLLIAELAAISIEKYDETIMLALIPMFILVMLEIIFAVVSIKNKKIRTLIEGKPSLIICDGKINYKEMVRTRYNLDDLLVSLRQKEIKTIEDVEFAFLEINGKLSIFKYDRFKKKSTYPMPLIIDGNIQEDTLKRIKKSKEWLIKELKNNKVSLDNVFYSFFKNKELYIIKTDKMKKEE